jgi:hypothetical protein
LIEFYKEQLRHQIERSPFSEDFIINTIEPLQLESVFGDKETRGDAGGCIVRGIFDNSIDHDVPHSATKPKPRLVLYLFPRNLPQDTTITIRGKQYKIRKQEADANIGYVIHLN